MNQWHRKCTEQSVRQLEWTDLLLEREQLSASKMWVTISPRDMTCSRVSQWAHRKALSPCRKFGVPYTNCVLGFSHLRNTRKLKNLVYIFWLNFPHAAKEKKHCLLLWWLLTDWSSFMGSCTLPLHWGTQGGSNIGTDGIPRTGEGRVKFILGGGI